MGTKSRSLLFKVPVVVIATTLLTILGGSSQAPGAGIAEAGASVNLYVITTAPGRPGTLPMRLINRSESTITYTLSASVSAGDWGVVLCYGQACRIGTGTVMESVDVDGGQTLSVEMKVIPTHDAQPGATAEVQLTASPRDGGAASEARGLVTVSP